MEDRILAGYRTVDSVAPVQLYAGEKQVVTTQGVVGSGQVLGLLNDQGTTSKFPIVALVAGELVEYNSAGADGSEVPYGVLPHALDTSATGYNADVDSPVIIEAVLNYEALDTAVAYAALKATFAELCPGIVIQKLY
jgi:hypothetical protein